MGRKLVGEATDFPSAHGVWLTRDRKRPAARFADPTRDQMAVDDCIDLIRAG